MLQLFIHGACGIARDAKESSGPARGRQFRACHQPAVEDGSPQLYVYGFSGIAGTSGWRLNVNLEQEVGGTPSWGPRVAQRFFPQVALFQRLGNLIIDTCGVYRLEQDMCRQVLAMQKINSLDILLDGVPLHRTHQADVQRFTPPFDQPVDGIWASDHYGLV